MSHSDTQSQGVDFNICFKNSVRSQKRAQNRFDARFRRQEELIRRGLEDALKRRRIGLKVSELCGQLKIAGSTFYSHYRNCDEALVQYELELEEEFVGLLPPGARRDLAFTLLLTFIARHRRYFSSTFRNRNLYLLARLVRHTCRLDAKVNQRSYVLYLCSVEAMIWHWGEYEKFADEKLDFCRKKLMSLRIMDY